MKVNRDPAADNAPGVVRITTLTFKKFPADRPWIDVKQWVSRQRWARGGPMTRNGGPLGLASDTRDARDGSRFQEDPVAAESPPANCGPLTPLVVDHRRPLPCRPAVRTAKAPRHLENA